jgi:hypothetical protein
MEADPTSESTRRRTVDYSVGEVCVAILQLQSRLRMVAATHARALLDCDLLPEVVLGLVGMSLLLFFE